jgi:phosphoribosyl-dephospho-CoA transferase
MPAQPSRHDLLLLDRDGWAATLRRHPALAAMKPVRAWAEQGFPAISRRRLPDDPPEAWPAAIALPPAQGRLRLALALDAADVATVVAPPLLQDAIEGRLAGRLPTAWTDKAARVVAVGARYGIVPRLFGSAMWQCVTAQPYVTDTSDLDLLWRVPARPTAVLDLPALAGELDEIARRDGPGLDGEILFQGIGAVHWREWLGAAPTDSLLVKRDNGVALVGRAELPGLATA